MRKRIICLICIIASLLMLSTLPVSADADGVLTLDSLSDSSAWSSTDGTVSHMNYNDETSVMSCGADDTGYLIVRNYESAAVGKPLEISRAFDRPFDLFSFEKVSFNINIFDLGGDAAKYTVKTTLFSSGPSYTYENVCDAGRWVRLSLPISDYSMRTDIYGIEISVTAEADTEVPLKLLYTVDRIEAEGRCDTSFTERFLSPSLEARGGRLIIKDGGVRAVSHPSGTCSIRGRLTVQGRYDGTKYEKIRFTVADSDDANVSLSVMYLDGSTYKTAEKSMYAGVTAPLFFEVPDIDKIYSFSLDVEGEGELLLYGAELIAAVEDKNVMPGTLDVCRMNGSGDVSLRGTVSPDAVVDHIGGTLSVYCIPAYGDIDEYIKNSEAAAEIDITTKFSITVSRQSLPTGFEAMRFITVIDDGENRVAASEPRSLSFSDDVGVHLPSAGKSIKGIIDADNTDGAGVSFFSVDANRLFGTAATGKLYSFGGSVYYFDNSYIAELDNKVKRTSLFGSACYLCINGPWDSMHSGSDSLSRLYAAVDYLSSRYSAPEYGFISGVTVGEAASSYSYSSADDCAERMAAVLSTAYRAGRSNIAGFRVIYNIGGVLAEYGRGDDAASVLYSLSKHSGELSGISCSVLVESENPINLGDAVNSFLKESSGWVDGVFAVCRPSSASDPRRTLAEFASYYYDACERDYFRGFMLSAAGLDYEPEFYDSFRLLDTDRHETAENYAGITGSGMERSYPLLFRDAELFSGNVVGSYTIFDFTNSFDTAGWFSRLDGECSTVRTNNGRVLRADENCGGILYSCADSPKNFSELPILRLTSYSSLPGEYILTVYSSAGACAASITLGTDAVTQSIDMTGFTGLSEVIGISLTPKGESGAIYVSKIEVCSMSRDDAALAEMMSGSDVDSQDGAAEENMLKIMAVILFAIVFGVLVLTVMRFRRPKRLEQK